MLAAYHLPALPRPPTTVWEYGKGEGAVRIRVPQLSSDLLRRQIEALVEARDRHLAERPVKEIVEIVDRAAARFTDPGDPLRRAAEATLPAVTSYSAPMIRRILGGMAVDWSAERLWQLLRTEFADPRVLDDFCPRPEARGMTRAFGPRFAAHVFSGNVPGVAVTSLIRSLLVKAATLGKTAAGEPVLPALFARAIAEADAGLGACVAVAYWPGGAEELEQIALDAADAVVVYGGREPIESVRGRVPSTTRFLGYGPKISFGVIGRDALDRADAERLALAAALDASTFDQQGCVSPHLFYVEEGGEISPREWAPMLGAAMERVQRELPRGALSPGEASAIRQLRGEAEFAQIGGEGAELHHSAEGTAWTVLFDPDPTFAASCLNRVVRVKPVSRLAEVPGLVAEIAPLLQTVGVAVGDDRWREVAAELGRRGVSRIAPIGRMAWPPPHWHHDGRPPLRDLVRWCDVEGVEE